MRMHEMRFPTLKFYFKLLLRAKKVSPNVDTCTVFVPIIVLFMFSVPPPHKCFYSFNRYNINSLHSLVT